MATKSKRKQRHHIADDGAYIPQGNKRWETPDYNRGAGRSPVRWEDREVALLVRRILWWQTHGSAAHLARLFAEAQEVELPEHRRRARTGLHVKSATILPALLDRGAGLQDTIADEPFDPMRRAWVEPAKAPKPAKAAEAVEAPNPPAPAPEPAVAPPGPVPGALSHQGLEEIIWKASQGFAIEVANMLAPAVNHFMKDTVGPVLDHTVAAMRAEQDALIKHMRFEQHAAATNLGQSISALVGKAIMDLLGGAPQVAVTPAAPAAPEVRKVSIDVVGFQHDKASVLRRLNGTEGLVDIRFFTPEEQRDYSPHSNRNVIVLGQRLPQVLRHKLRASGCVYKQSAPTVEAVVRSITDMVKARGATPQ
jgi:hypothetical protein